MKKYNLYLIAAILFVSAAIVSCDKDDDDDDGGLSTSTVGTIDAKVENGNAFNDLIDEVKLVTLGNSGVVVLATAKFSNGGFKIGLPETVPSNVLRSFDEQGGVDEDLEVSNMNVKTTFTSLFAYDEDGDWIGGFFYFKEDATTFVGMQLVYADGDVNITGETTDEDGTETWSVYLKKGWNQMFFIDKEWPNDKWESTSTTTSQSGLKWYFSDDDGW